jgi:hypothetical protein
MTFRIHPSTGPWSRDCIPQPHSAFRPGAGPGTEAAEQGDNKNITTTTTLAGLSLPRTPTPCFVLRGGGGNS